MFYIYKFFNKENHLIYIGKTINLDQRIISHQGEHNWKRTEIHRIEYAKCVTKTDMDIYEIYYINKLKPKYNISLVNHDEPSLDLEELKFTKYLSNNEIKKLNHEESQELKYFSPSLLEQRLMYYIGQELKYQNKANTEKGNKIYITLDISYFVGRFPTKSRSYKQDIQNTLSKIVNRYNKIFKSYHYIDREGIVLLSIYSKHTKEVLQYTQTYYISYNYKIKNIHTYKLYNSLLEEKFVYTFEDLKKLFNVWGSVYLNYSNLKQRVLNPIRADLLKSNIISIDYDEIKVNRKVVGVQIVLNN